LADEKGQFCGKLMADLGADVIKIEPPGGQQTRTLGPFLHDMPHRERSLSFWHYNTSKRGLTLNLETEDGQELFRRLASTADIILETLPPGYLPARGLGYEELSKPNPKLIMCSLTDFGQSGPWKDYQTSDLLHMAAGGQMASCGYDPEDVPDAPPIAPDGGNAWHMAGHYTYIGILAALAYRDVTGKGQYIDASVHDACALTTESAVAIYLYTGEVVERHTGRHAAVGPSDRLQMATWDGGWVNTTRSGTNLNPTRLRRLAEWLDRYGLAGDLLDEKYQQQSAIEEVRGQVTDTIREFFTHLTLEEAWRGGQERNFPWGAVRTMDELMDDAHLADRGFYVDVPHPELGKHFIYPGPAALYNGSPWTISRRAPLIGEHNVDIFGDELGLSKQALTVLAEAGVI
jgi:crotonobetainyl-CoA:carnitine CoA-transferase CaiB-like acyl-CoA transferase